MQLCNCVVSRGFISTTNDRMQKKSEMFFCFCRRPTTKRLQKGVLQLCNSVLFDRIKKTKVSTMGPKLAPKRDAKLDAARRNRCIKSVLLVILIMTSVVAQAVTLPTAALAVEAGPLRGKSEPTEGMPHRELVEYPVRITARKYACRCGCSGCSWPLDSSL